MQRTTKGLVWTAALTTISVFAAQANALNSVNYDGNGLTGVAGSLTNTAGWLNAGPTDFSTGVADPTASGGTYWNINDNSTSLKMRFLNSQDMSDTGSRAMTMSRIRVNSGNAQGTFGVSIASGTNGQGMIMGARAGEVVFRDGQGNSGPSNVPLNTSVWRVYALEWRDANLESGSALVRGWYLNDAGVAATGGHWSSNPAHWTQFFNFTGAFSTPNDGVTNENTALITKGVFLGSQDSARLSNVDVDWINWNRNDGEQEPWTVLNVPVPEPMTLAMLALGAIPMAMRRRRVAA